MECSAITTLEIHGTQPLKHRSRKEYIVLYTCQTQIHEILSKIGSSGSFSTLDYWVQDKIKDFGDSGNCTDTRTLCRNWKIKAKCIHLTEGDLSWISKISHLQNIHLATSELINWLSTLGGGWSALGDSSAYAARQCFNVSKQQLLLATKLQFPELVASCWLYTALSLMQLGKRKQARNIILCQSSTVKRYKYQRTLTSLYSATVFKYKASGGL